jgi:antirestriction protein
MEQQPQPAGGDQQPANSYGTDDPIRQAEIEAARSAASQERRRDRARLEQLVEQGADPDEAEAIIEFEYARHDRLADAAPANPDTAASAERRRYQPRVYVADLASHYQGLEHGQWLNAARESDELRADIAALLARSPVPEATDWQVQASAHFAGLDLHGCTDLHLITRLGRGVAEHGAAYAAYVAMTGTADPDLLDRFDDFYIGSYDDLEAWGRSLSDDFEWNAHLDEVVEPLIRPHLRIDYTAVGRAARDSWDVLPGHDGRLHVFLR